MKIKGFFANFILVLMGGGGLNVPITDRLIANFSFVNLILKETLVESTPPPPSELRFV